MSEPAAKGKKLQVFKFSVINASINWKSRKRCNYFMKDGKAAHRCPEYKARGKKLEEVIEKIGDFRDNVDHFIPAWKEAVSFSESTIPKGYLRRNAKKFRMARPFYNQKRNEFNDLMREKPKQIQTKKYAENINFIHHLETFHGYDANDLICEPNALDSMLLPSPNVDRFSQDSLRNFSRQTLPSSSSKGYHHQQQQPHSSRPTSRQLNLPPPSSFQQSRSNSRQQNLPPPSLQQFNYSRPTSRQQNLPHSSQSNSRQQMLPPSSRSAAGVRSQSSHLTSTRPFQPTKLESQPHSSRQLMLPPPHPRNVAPDRSQSSRPSSSRPPPSTQSYREQPHPSRSYSNQQQQQMPPPSFHRHHSEQQHLSSNLRLQQQMPQPSRSNPRPQQQMPPPVHSNYRPQNIPSSRSSSRSQNIPSSYSNSSSQRPQQCYSNSRQLALPPPPPVPRPSSSRQQPPREVVLFESKSPAPSKRYNGPEISQISTSSSRRRPFQNLNHNGNNSFTEQSSFNQIASILDFDDENGLLRSFYTKYHLDQFCVDDDEKDYKTIEEFANSDLIEHSIENPPPNGLRLREYTKTDYKKMRKSTKKILREWKESLGPGLYDEDAPSGYEDDGEEPIETWNRLVRESKKKSRKRPYNHRQSLNVETRKTEFANESFDSVQSEPPQFTIQETIQRTRKIVATSRFKDLRKVGQNTTPKIVEIPVIKRTGSCVNSGRSSSPPKKRRQTAAQAAEATPKILKSQQLSTLSSFKTPLNSRNSTITIKTPSTIDIFHRLQSSGNDSQSPVRRSPRTLKAICYKI